MVDIVTIIELGLIVVIGIPFAMVFIIPTLIYLGGRYKFVPKFESLIIYFGIEVNKPPYSDWMERSPILFISMTAIEVYISWYLIKVIRFVKWAVLGVYHLVIGIAKWQWKKYEEYDKELGAQENKGGTVQ